MTELCKSCARQNFCGNNITKYYCTGYMPHVETRREADDIKVPPFTDEQKKLIEMTEKLANGKLICDVDDDIDEVEMTNEEYLKSLGTEQLAETLYHITCFTEPLFVKCMRKQTDADAEKAIMEWLKQPHQKE